MGRIDPSLVASVEYRMDCDELAILEDADLA
ncbi:hypothetical protein HNO88_004539, partial [Novosphingobium chloroacetimidivorans]|nr:hypothetical protein [Novosphingobium chloroacetimidivorans]